MNKWPLQFAFHMNQKYAKNNCVSCNKTAVNTGSHSLTLMKMTLPLKFCPLDMISFSYWISAILLK